MSEFIRAGDLFQMAIDAREKERERFFNQQIERCKKCIMDRGTKGFLDTDQDQWFYLSKENVDQLKKNGYKITEHPSISIRFEGPERTKIYYCMISWNIQRSGMYE